MITYEEYRKKWNNNPKNFVVERLSIHIDCELITRCNFRCKKCFQSFAPPEPLEMPWKMYVKIINEAAKKGVCSVKLNYRGEPMLYKDLHHAIKYAKERGILEVMFNTNASLLNFYKIGDILDSGVDKIICSVDSCQNDVYKKLQGGDLKTIVKNISNLVRVRNLAKIPTKIVVIGIKQEENKEEMESGMYEIFWKNIVDEVIIDAFNDYRCEKDVTPRDFCCEDLWRRLTIRADGKVQACCGLAMDSKIVGDINESSLEEIWHGTLEYNYRELHQCNKSHEVEMCQTCDYRNRGKKIV